MSASTSRRRILDALAFSLALAAPVVAPAAAGAQTLDLKRTFASATAGVCPGFAAPPPATPQRVQEARRLFSLGQEASIVGDHRAARDLFRQAQEQNGGDERIAYYLGRSDEELKLPAEALAQYCRYLSLAPNGSDADDARVRLDRLATATAKGGTAAPSAGRRAAAAARFQAGVSAADRGQLAEAERAFSEVVSQLPNAPEAYFDRAVVRGRARDWAGTERDLSRYLSLRPDAEDAAAVRERLDLVRRAGLNPAAALGGGIVLPGFGQYYTRRPVFGGLVTAAAAGALVYAFLPVERKRDVTFLDAFGNPYTQTVTDTGTFHRNTGLAIAGGVSLLGAVESYIYARSRQQQARRVFARRDDERTAGGLAGWVAPVGVVTSGGERRLAVGVGATMTF